MEFLANAPASCLQLYIELLEKGSLLDTAISSVGSGKWDVQQLSFIVIFANFILYRFHLLQLAVIFLEGCWYGKLNKVSTIAEC